MAAAQTIINGLMLGSGYALLAVGYTLVFGTTRLLTLAQGQIFMLSGAVALLAVQWYGVPLAVAVLIAVAVGGAMGLVTDLLCFRPISSKARLAPAVATIGLALVLQSSLVVLHGSDPIALPGDFTPSDIHVGTLLISVPQLVMLVIALVLMAGLGWFIRSTRWGAALRGMSEDPAALDLLGINAKVVATSVLVASGMLAGVAGILWAIRVGRISPFDGTLAGLTGLAVMTIAGLGSLGGAVVVGIGLGVVESFARYYQLEGIEPALPWIMVVAVLLIRPQGLFSRSST